MPSLSQNQSVWGRDYDWSRRGDEWSDSWGGVTFQWWTTLFPRLQGLVPAQRILEIAPGYGRWTHFLRDLCDELIIVDIAAAAIEHCRERFAGDAHVQAHVNDGSSLAMAADRSVDLVFSFDSLVHAEADVIAGYLPEFARTLGPDGVAFIHHSNMGQYPAGTYDPNNIHWRATSVSAALVEEMCGQVGLSCVSQETVAWGNEALLNDCFTVLTRAGSRWDRPNILVENLAFSRNEIAMAKRLSQQYAPFNMNLRVHLSDPDRTAETHADAVALHERQDPARAYAVLYEELRRVIDPELLNDFAVIAASTGRAAEAGDVLRATLAVHPEHAAARQNLELLGQIDPPGAPPAGRS